MSESITLPRDLFVDILCKAERPEVPAFWLHYAGMEAARDERIWTKAYRQRFHQLPQEFQVMGQFLAMMRSIADISPEDATAILQAALDPDTWSVQDALSNHIDFIAGNMEGLVRTCIAAGANLEDPVIIWNATNLGTDKKNTLLVYRAIEESGVDITQIKIPGNWEKKIAGKWGDDEDGCPYTCPGESLLHQATLVANNPVAVEYLLDKGADPVAFLESYRDCQGRPAADGLTFQPPFDRGCRDILVAFQRAGANLQPLLDNSKLHTHLENEAVFEIEQGTTVDKALNRMNRRKQERLSIIRFIMGLGVDLNSPDQEGNRLLHTAVKRWIDVEEASNEHRQKRIGSESEAEQLRFWARYWMEITQLLISRGADLTLTDADGKTARQLAEASPLLESRDIVEAFTPPADRTIEATDNPRALKRMKLDADAQGCPAAPSPPPAS
jgi:ankyrin repeat protein